MATFIDRIKNVILVKEEPKAEIPIKSEANFMGFAMGLNHFFDGQKNIGELGIPKQYSLNYGILRIRSWQSFIDSEIARTVFNKFTIWIVGSGLRLQANPNITALKSEGIDFKNKEDFNEVIESRFSVWANSKLSSYSGMINLGEVANEAFKNAKIGGDVLVVLRYEDGCINAQLIDGAHVCSPLMGDDNYAAVLNNGNTIRNGVEFDKKGKHVAYHVMESMGQTTRISAIDESTGLTTAYLVYGSKYRLDNTRGLPIIATVLESLSKLERYKEAAVGSAEERAKIVYQIVHSLGSTGESPLVKQMAKAFDASGSGEAKDIDGKSLADTVAATTNKTTFNMPINSELRALESRNEMFFAEFYKTNSDIICATLGIPPNVAYSLYNDSFSASRAATKDWEHTMKVEREYFSTQFYAPIYELFLFTEIMKNKVNAVGYIEAFQKSNRFVLAAYTCARWVGDMFPHIDPEKEARAERLKLGDLAKDIPLTTIENSVEVLNTGDSDANIEQFAKELELFKQVIHQPIQQP